MKVFKERKTLVSLQKTSAYMKHYYKKTLNPNSVLFCTSASEGPLIPKVQELIAIPRENWKVTNSVNVKEGSRTFLRLLAAASYIVTDEEFPSYYVKKQGQVCITICTEKIRSKMVLQAKSDLEEFGLRQRSLFLSDYIVCKDEKEMRQLCSFYHLDNLYKGQFVLPDGQVKPEGNGKDNVLIYVGDLRQNGLTASFYNLMGQVDLEKRNYYLAVDTREAKRYPQRYARIPRGISVAAVDEGCLRTYSEEMACRMYYDQNKDNYYTRKHMRRLYNREFYRHYGHLNLDYCIHFTGYQEDSIHTFKYFSGKRIIYVHNDMQKEIQEGHHQHYLTLREAYRKYNKVAVVTEYLVEPTVFISKKRDNVYVVNNCHGHEKALKQSRELITFDPETECTVPRGELLKILEGQGTKILTIGKYEPEKAHTLLIDAFDQFWEDHSDSYLIIIGGYGSLYEKTRQYIQNVDSGSHIILIRSVHNPLAVAKYCDLFVLPSYYEGLPITMHEAISLGLPTICSDIPGMGEFNRRHGGYLVSPDVDSIYQGLLDFEKGKVKCMEVDYTEYNQGALEEFETLFR